MKYDVMTDYKSVLGRTLRPQTARTYYNRLDILLEGQNLTNIIENLDIQKILNNLSNVKYKNHFSQSKNALLYFLEWQNITLDEKYKEQIKELEKCAYKKYRKMEKVDFSKVVKTLKHLKNERLKLSYQTLLETGLRVSELSQITPRKATIDNNEIVFSFTGKGGKHEKVKLTQEECPKLYESLKKRIESTAKDQKMFYSANYLQTKSKELGFKCHDLRRAYAKIEYKKTKSKEEVRQKLRHTKIKTTNLYLTSKVKI